MIKRELKSSYKSLLIWIGVTALLFLVVYLIYPLILSSMPPEKLKEMIDMFPEEMVKTFNMDLSSIESVYGWLKSEGFVFMILIIGAYSAILGSNILLKEENDKTIEYLGVMPLTRTRIVLEKCLVGVINILAFTLIIMLFNYVGLTLSESFDQKEFIIISLSTIMPSLALYFICLFISTFTNKTKKMLGVSLGIVFISYAFNTIATLSKEAEFLKYFSVFTLSPIRDIMQNNANGIICIIVTVAICLLMLLLTITRYNKKELL